jgi:hypothetical protein
LSSFNAGRQSAAACAEAGRLHVRVCDFEVDVYVPMTAADYKESRSIGFSQKLR